MLPKHPQIKQCRNFITCVVTTAIYVEDFENEKKHLEARRKTIQKDIKEARNRNENEIESEVELWIEEADSLIKEDTKGKEKWFGLVTNCFWQYNRGKDLEDKKQRIQKLVGQRFRRVARPTPPLGIKLYNENFMQLKDRKFQFGKLTEALKNDKRFVIGLYGLGGTGKTTMAKEVGIKLAESKVFDKVIFSVVSKDANLKQIRDDIAQQLNLPSKEGTQQAQELWKRIAEGGEKVLLILDDVWEKLPLRDIGIPLDCHGKSCCSILLTTRHRRVCSDMGCPEPIELEVLSVEDAVDLFLSYAADKSKDSSSNDFNDFKNVAFGIVKECGRLPVAIVLVARALRYKSLEEWKQGLERLRNPKSAHDINGDLKEAYSSLILSYDYLENKEAKQLFLLCSLFPDDYEIPIELLTRIAIGMGLCGRADKYSVARSHFTPIKDVLMDSCLLLKVGNEAVEMHDLVREVALWIGNKLVQVVMDSSTTLMENTQYSSWNINEFPSHFDGRKLEVLLLWISNNANSTTPKIPNGIFEGMENLKILALTNWSNIKTLGASLFQSHRSLIYVRSLAIKGFELGDISFLVNLKSLESLKLSECSMIELPKEIRELEKLRLLEMERCFLERNNPFEVIGSCLKLEELYFVSNRIDKACELERYQITTFPELERYQINKAWSGSYYEVDFSISRYFDSENLRVKFSVEIFKSLVARAEVLKLDGDYSNTGWTNVVPDILPMNDDNMEDHLTRLCLKSMNGIKCLIRKEHLRFGVAIFSKLVELELYKMDVRELCHGPYPVNFLKQLEKLFLSECKNLEGSLFDEKLELCNLKSIHLDKCSMTCLFHPFTAQSLRQLEKLRIYECSGLKYIVAEPMEDHDPNQKSHDSMFPKLKYLKVRFCHALEFILPICFCKDLPLLENMEISSCDELKYIFGQYPEERDLHQMGKEVILQSLEELKIAGVPNFINLYAECYLPSTCSDKVQKSSPSTNVEDCTSSLSGGRLCCFWPKSKASTIYHPYAFTNHNEAMELNYVVNGAHGLFTPPLYPYAHLRRLEIFKLSGLKSLFTLSIVSSLKLLEILEVLYCDTLEHIVTDKEDDHDHDHMNVNSIFPNLREIEVFSCRTLEYLAPHQVLFPELRKIEVRYCISMQYLFSISSGMLPRLMCMEIQDNPQLGEVFRWKHGEGQKLVMGDVFPRLYLIRLVNLPTLHTICQGIDFHALKLRRVRECPALSLTSANDSNEERDKLLLSFERNSVHEDEDASYVRMTIFKWDLAAHKELQMVNEAAIKFIQGSIEYKQNRSSPNLLESEEVSKEIAREDSTKNNNLSNLTKSTKTSANEIVEEKLSTTPSSELDMAEDERRLKAVVERYIEQHKHNRISLSENLKATFGEGPSEKCGKASSSKLSGKESMDDDQQAHGKSRSSNEAPQRIEEPTKEWSYTKTSNEVSLKIPPPYVTKMTSALVEVMTNDKTGTDEEEMKFDQKSSSQIFEEHDLMGLFQMMKEGADMEVDMCYVSKLIADLHHNKEVTKALVDLEASLKKGLNEIACSEESRLRLQNALNMLSSHCFEDGASSHGLQDTIQSLQQEIQTVLSSFNQGYATIDTFTKLEQKEKLMIEQRSQREKDAKTLLYNINTTKNSIAAVQLNEVELKEQISKLQAELRCKEEEIEEYKRKLLSLQEQEKKSISDTIEFTMEFMAMEKERFRMVEDQMKARQQLENMDAKWSSCLSNLKKTMILFGVHLKQKL